MAADHTPTPWTVGQRAGTYPRGLTIYAADAVIADMQLPHLLGTKAERDANAEFIVRAVNCHDELVAALNDLWLWATEQRTHLTTDPVPDGLGAKVIDALAKAEATHHD